MTERDGGGWGRIKYVLKQLLKNGRDREQLLSTTSGTMSDEELEEMSSCDNSKTDVMQRWLERLEQYNVFFSAPLDIDFLMLENMGDNYKETLDKKEGPRVNVAKGESVEQVYIRDIENSGLSYPEYAERVKKDIGLTLKDHGGSGATYTPEQQKLMVWYVYFFLNRGKPSTHIAALSTISTVMPNGSIPPVLKRLITKAEKMLKGDTNENYPT